VATIKTELAKTGRRETAHRAGARCPRDTLDNSNGWAPATKWLFPVREDRQSPRRSPARSATRIRSRPSRARATKSARTCLGGLSAEAGRHKS